MSDEEKNPPAVKLYPFSRLGKRGRIVGDLMPTATFIKACRARVFTPYDGWGRYSTGELETDLRIDPADASKAGFEPDPRFPFVIWFNK